MTPEPPIDWSEISILSILVGFSMLSVMAFATAMELNGVNPEKHKGGRSL